MDITNNCNCDCIACWTYSPLLGERKASKEWRKQQLSSDIIEKLVDKLGTMGTKEIRLTGGGEPFIHKDVMAIIRYIKEKGLICSVTTNLTLIDNTKVLELVSLGLDVLTASIWAGDSETYCTTHPNQSPDTFIRITEILKELKSIRGRKPKLVISNVITGLNYHNIEQMVDYAQEMGAEEVYFAVTDPMEGKTDSLLLNDSQRVAVLEKIELLKQRYSGQGTIRLDAIEQFTRRLSNPDSQKGMYDNNIINEVPCYAGWTFARIMADGNVSPCCRAVNIPTGNIYNDDFLTIWNGKKQKTFRKMALKGDKMSPFFLEIGCYKTCDNLPQNQWLHQRITTLSDEQRSILFERVKQLR